MMRWFLLALALLVGAEAAAAERFEGRRFELFDGRNGDGPAPLVLLLHGGGGTGPQFRENSGFDALVRENGLVAVYPSSPDRLWNDGRDMSRFRLSRDPDRDDAGYLLRLIALLVEKGLAAPDQVYVVGHSMGGGMAMRLSCAAGARLAGIAVIATKQVVGAECPDAPPTPTLFIHGTEDKVSPHDGDPTGYGGAAGRYRGASLSSEETLALWSARNRCERLGAPRLSDPASGDGTRLRVVEGQGCAAPLRLVAIEGGGHAWPGARRIPRWRRLRRLLEPYTEDLDAGRAAMAFFFGG